MTLGFSTTLRNNRATQTLNAIDANASAGQILIYSGTRPATGAAITAQLLLATLTLSKPSGTVSGGVLTLAAITSGTGSAAATASGTDATWARIVDGGGTFVADASVGTSGADINLSAVHIVTGATVSVTSGTITEGNA
jgi:hypothetical protein